MVQGVFHRAVEQGLGRADEHPAVQGVIERLRESSMRPTDERLDANYGVCGGSLPRLSSTSP